MLLWKPVITGMASYSDIMNMTVSDLYDLHEVMDIKEALEREAQEVSKNKR